MAFVCRFSNNNHDIQCQSSVGYIDNKYSVGFSNMQIDIRCGVQACGISGWNIIRSMDVSRGSHKLCIDIDWSCITREWSYIMSYYFQDCYVYSTAYTESIYKSGLYG